MNHMNGTGDYSITDSVTDRISQGINPMDMKIQVNLPI